MNCRARRSFRRRIVRRSIGLPVVRWSMRRKNVLKSGRLRRFLSFASGTAFEFLLL